MSILIKKIELPETGFKLIGLWASGEVSSSKGPMTAINVPPHGRLIDADALLKKIRCRPLDEHGEYLLWYVDEDDIKNAPTIIPPEEEETT